MSLSPEAVEAALAQIRKRRANYDYFFGRLTSPEWLEPLAAAGFFKDPPGFLHTGEFYSIPSWPESAYLTRVAKAAPAVVARIINGIPETVNPRVHDDIARAALQLAPADAERWAAREVAWVESQKRIDLLLPETYADVISYLADNGRRSVAFRFATALLGVVWTETDPPEAQAKCDTWILERAMEKFVPSLQRLDRDETLSMLSTALLSTLLRANVEDAAERFSATLWRPAIERHAQNSGHGGLRDLLIDAVRESALFAAVDEASTERVYGSLLARKQFLFTRIGLYLLAERLEVAPALARAAVVTEELFRDVSLHHEYFTLIKRAFPVLAPQERERVLEWILAGPPRDGDETSSEAEDFAGYWKLRWLDWLAPYLPPRIASFHSELLAKYGQPAHPDFLSYLTFWSGPTSPLGEDQLGAMSPEKIADFLRSWKPSGDRRSSDPEGLGRQLSAAVKTRAREFSGSLKSFVGVDPTYARALTSGLSDAVNGGAEINWEKTLLFAGWIFEQPPATGPVSPHSFSRDPHFGWSRRAVLQLLMAGFDRDVLPASLAYDSYRLIDLGAHDPDPTESDDRSATMDPATRSINSTRGDAMHAVVHYALWRRRAVEGEPGFVASFSAMPEVRRLLEERLIPELEPSPAVRAVYGQWFPWLVLLDRAWSAEAVPQIFPSNSEVLCSAAWDTYLLLASAYIEPFRLLREQYRAAVSALKSHARIGKDGLLGRTDVKLGEHLMLMLARGEIHWSSDDALMRDFFSAAPTEVLASTVLFGGRVLREFDGDARADEVARLRSVWEAIEEAEIARTSPRREVLEAFGWWFVSEGLAPEWKLLHLEVSIRIAGSIEPDGSVVESLASLAPRFPRQSFEILRQLVRGDLEGWKIHSWATGAKSVLSSALQHEPTKEQAVGLIHELGARGFHEFGSLLQDSDERVT